MAELAAHTSEKEEGCATCYFLIPKREKFFRHQGQIHCLDCAQRKGIAPPTPTLLDDMVEALSNLIHLVRPRRK